MGPFPPRGCSIAAGRAAQPRAGPSPDTLNPSWDLSDLPASEMGLTDEEPSV